MSSWSSENATKAYLQALKMGKRGKEPDVGEFISALAAGNNAQLIVMACSSIAVSRTLALVAAARQTGGRVVCILSGVIGDIDASKKSLGRYANCIEFVKGDAQKLLMGDYKGADFVLIDCNIDIDGHEKVFRAAKESVMHGSGAGVIVGYNALPKESWRGYKTHFLPIGEGLLVTRIGENSDVGGGRKRSRWVVTVDKCTGEEHAFRVTSSSSPRKVIEA